MQSRWQALMLELGFNDNVNHYRKLLAAYGEKSRHYHSMAHISDCLDKLAMYRKAHSGMAEGLARKLQAVELAIWFHDAIYRAFQKDNEEQSALLAKTFLLANSAEASFTDLVEKLILATKHHTHEYGDIEFQLMLDIDLSILGAEVEAFSAYEVGIREEYRAVPGPIYRRKRKQVLQAFSDMPQIYRSAFFYKLFEQQARINLASALARL